MLFSCLFYRSENWGTEKYCNLLNVTYLVNDRDGIWVQAACIQNLDSEILYYTVSQRRKFQSTVHSEKDKCVGISAQHKTFSITYSIQLRALTILRNTSSH